MTEPSLFNRGPLDAAHIARFWPKVARGGSNECWPWTGYIGSQGYGQFTLHRKTTKAHRVAYVLTKGPITEGLVIDHLCRNRSCCNPDHLELVSNRDNVLRGVGLSAEAARKTHCLHGHPFSGDNLYSKGGRRSCRECKRAYDLRRRAAFYAERGPLPPQPRNRGRFATAIRKGDPA